MNIEYEAIHLIARLKPGIVNSTETAVLYALACYAGYRVSNPGLAELAQHTKLHRTAILRALASLEAKELILIDHFEPRKDQARGTNEYHFTEWDDDWLLAATSSGERLVAESDLTSSGERPDLINLLREPVYERTSGIRIEESEASSKTIRPVAAKPAEPERRNGNEDHKANVRKLAAQRRAFLREQRRKLG